MNVPDSINIETIASFVHEASRIMLSPPRNLIEKDGPSNFVTETDLNIQAYLTEKLTAYLPGSVVLGEEGDNAVAPGADYVWIIDPVDGTSNYSRGIALSVVSVALYVHGSPYMGVVYEPYRDELFTAEKGKGAFLNGEPIKVSSRDMRHSLLCSGMSIYDKSLAGPCFNIIRRIYPISDDMRRLGAAALELCYLAAGRAELYFEIRVCPWDAAAALLIIEEAGGFHSTIFPADFLENKPFLLAAANSAESLERLTGIIKEEVPYKPY